MKPGWKTSEFWVTGLIVLATVCGWAGDKLDGTWATIAAALAAAAYSASRAVAKQGDQTDANVRAQVLSVLRSVAVAGSHDGVSKPATKPGGTGAPGPGA